MPFNKIRLTIAAKVKTFMLVPYNVLEGAAAAALEL